MEELEKKEQAEEERIKEEEKRLREKRRQEIIAWEEARKNSVGAKVEKIMLNIFSITGTIAVWLTLAIFLFGAIMSTINYFEGLSPIP